jgi:hypothetical protein
MSNIKRIRALLTSVSLSLAAMVGLAWTAPAGAVDVPVYVFLGQYSSSTVYQIGALVTYNGSLYVSSALNNKGAAPNTHGNVWALVSAQQGSPGAQGSSGFAGSAGPRGPAGPTGAAGSVGPIGPTGPAGATGAQGKQGLQGPGGPAGAAGAQGPQGVAGPAGAPGAKGPAGPTGPTGLAGPIGPAGVTGAAGGIGPPGLPGAAGAQGPQGLQGPQGQQGPAGANGAGLPSCGNDYTVLVQGNLTCQPRFNVNGDGTLTDNQTGLMWELQTSACQGEITCSTNVFSWSASTADSNQDGTLFTSLLATLNSNTGSGSSTCLANYCDWRIPNIVELQTIIEASATGCVPPTSGAAPCIDAAFGPTQPGLYWASTTYMGIAESCPSGTTICAWYVDFGDTAVLPNVKAYTYSARAVRGGR